MICYIMLYEVGEAQRGDEEDRTAEMCHNGDMMNGGGRTGCSSAIRP